MRLNRSEQLMRYLQRIVTLADTVRRYKQRVKHLTNELQFTANTVRNQRRTLQNQEARLTTCRAEIAMLREYNHATATSVPHFIEDDTNETS